MQVNNFILNNIPENIMILDPSGETKFLSDYCKRFMENCHLSLEPQDFFIKIKDLQEQCDSNRTSSTLHGESNTIRSRLLSDHNEPNSRGGTLQGLVMNFKSIIMQRNLQERQFLIYHGKLKGEEEKSIEIKISFVHHFKNEYIILLLRDTTQRDHLLQYLMNDAIL